MKEKGFTLIELLVVVAIIGVLASIAVPVFSDYKTRAYDLVAKQQVVDMRTGVEAYLVEEELRPSSVSFQIDPNGVLNGGAAALVSGFNHTKGVSITVDIFDSSLIGNYNIRAYHCKGSEFSTGIRKTYSFSNETGRIEENILDTGPGSCL